MLLGEKDVPRLTREIGSLSSQPGVFVDALDANGNVQASATDGKDVHESSCHCCAMRLGLSGATPQEPRSNDDDGNPGRVAGSLAPVRSVHG
jgi:hypothetical protein